MNLIDVNEQFKTDEQCLVYLEKMRWPEGVRCVTCGGNHISRITRETKTKNKRTTFYQCLEPTCKQQFSPTAGTIFHDSHLPLHKWFMALALIVDAKKGMSAKQLQRHLKIGSYRTAWYLAHRIRKAMEDTEGSLLTGTVEADEVYIGGRYDKRRKRGPWEKTPVVGVIERGGRIRTKKIESAGTKQIVGVVTDNVQQGATLMTDESRAYKSLGTIYNHQTVNHIAMEWVRGDCHTNSIEGYWSLLKRGIIGSFHKVSVKHLDRYLSEFEYRFNNRKNLEIFEQTVARMCHAGNMEYKQLIGRITESF
jgi:transposase-like protein